MTTANDTIRTMRDAGIIPDATAAALLPAPRRAAAPCRNHRGSARRPEGPCGQPVARVYEQTIGGEWKHAHTLCAKCLPDEAQFMDPAYNRVVTI